MKSRSNPFLVATLVFVSAATLQAATFHWDGNDTTADADGGDGTWDTTLTNWNDAATGGASIAWPTPSTGDDDAVFAGAVGLVTIDAGGITANDITFSTAGYTITGGLLTLDGATNIIAASPLSNNVATISAPISSTAGLIRSGSGTLTLNGDNTLLAGAITVENPPVATNAGGLVLSGANAAGTVSTFNVNGSGGAVTDGGWLGLADGATIASTAVVNLSGQGGNAAPPGTLRCTAGDATVNGAINLLTGNTRISNQGTSLTLNGPVTAATASGFGVMLRFASNQGITFTNTSNYWEGTTQLHDGSYFFQPGTLPVTSNLQMAGSTNTWFETSGSFTRAIGTGAGQVRFNATSVRVNGFSARGGPLTVNIGGAVTPSTLVWGVDDFVPAILGLSGSNSDGTLTWLNPIDLNGAARTVNVLNGTADVDAHITGAISGIDSSQFRKTGTGMLLLSTENSHAGGTVIVASQGAINALRISNDNALGTGTLSIGSGGNNDQSRLELTGGITVANSIATLTSRTNDVPNILNISGNNTISANISAGSGGSRTTIESAADKLTLGGSVSVRQLNLFGEGEGEISGNVTNSSGNILNKAGAGKWTIGGNMTNNTGVTIAAGTLQIGNGGATGSLGAAPTITNDGALIFDRSGEVSIPGAISGSGTITKRGTSAITLSGATIEHAGATAIEDGSLIITGDATNATGAVTVGDGIGDANTAILGGTGPIGGAVTLASDGAIAPGTSVGTLTANSNVAGAGALLVEMDGAVADQLIVGGTLDISAMTLDLSTINAPTETVYVIVNAGSAITGAPFAAVTGSIPGYEVTYNYNDGVDTHNIALIGAPPSDPFDTWATTTNGLAGLDATATADPDNDGLDNLIEFVIGGQPNPANPNADSSSLAPTVSTDANNLVFTFRRTDLALSQPGIIIAAEYGSDLADWTTATDGVGGVTVVPTEDHYGAGIDRIVVTLPKALVPGTKMFARLNVMIP